MKVALDNKSNMMLAKITELDNCDRCEGSAAKLGPMGARAEAKKGAIESWPVKRNEKRK